MIFIHIIESLKVALPILATKVCRNWVKNPTSCMQDKHFINLTTAQVILRCTKWHIQWIKIMLIWNRICKDNTLYISLSLSLSLSLSNTLTIVKQYENRYLYTYPSSHYLSNRYVHMIIFYSLWSRLSWERLRQTLSLSVLWSELCI